MATRPRIINFGASRLLQRFTQISFTRVWGNLVSKELLTFQEVVGPEALAILHVFHHIISKFVHVSRCPGENMSEKGHTLLPGLLRDGASYNVSETGLWEAATEAAPTHKITDSMCAC